MYTAKFPLVDRAKRFADRINEPGWWAENVVQQGRTVTWDVAFPDNVDNESRRSYLGDMLESVGYYGSDDRRKATLNGLTAPVSY